MPSPTFTTPNTGQHRNDGYAVSAAASKWNVPFWVLWGVYGMETNFGADVHTSSAGAKGPFQFLPGTAAGVAKKHGIPDNYSNTLSSANLAGAYLSDLYKQYGSWDAALQHYSGGGYGAAAVQQKASASGVTASQADPSNLLQQGILGSHGPLSGIGDLLNFPSAILDAASAIVAFFKTILSIDFWLRVGKGLAGATLIYMGLHGLTGAGPEPSTVGKAAAGAAMVVK